MQKNGFMLFLPTPEYHTGMYADHHTDEKSILTNL